MFVSHSDETLIFVSLSLYPLSLSLSQIYKTYPQVRIKRKK